jgi:hypothetical protein
MTGARAMDCFPIYALGNEIVSNPKGLSLFGNFYISAESTGRMTTWQRKVGSQLEKEAVILAWSGK